MVTFLLRPYFSHIRPSPSPFLIRPGQSRPNQKWSKLKVIKKQKSDTDIDTDTDTDSDTGIQIQTQAETKELS